MKILYFGIYSKGMEYPRNNNLVRALRSNGAEVTEAHFGLAGTFHKRISAVKRPIQAIKFFLGLLSSFVVLLWKFIKIPPVDVVIVGHPGYFHVHLAWLLCRLFKKKAILVYDVFIPLYEALVEDRRLVKPGSFLGYWLRRFERSCCRYADLCLIDTDAHCRYLIDTYELPFERVSRIFVGPTIDQGTDLYQSIDKEIFKVLFVGTYISLHGIEVILAAARCLANDSSISFFLVGSGQLRQEMELLTRKWELTNVIFKDWIPTGSLGQFIRSFDLSLGIFGGTPKAARVIPSKIFDICAAGVPFITSDTPAIREVFINGKNAYLIPPGDPKALADAIIELKENSDLRRNIAEGARQTGKSIFSLKSISNDLIDAISKVQKS